MRTIFCALLVVSTLRLVAGEVEIALPKPVVVIHLDQAADLAEAAWGPVVTLDDIKGRTLKPGVAGVINIPAWWGEGLRPKKGENYRAMISFRDASPEPIRVELMASLPGRFEMHRIGGLNDKKWKAVYIPLPWDFLWRKPDGKVELVLTAPASSEVVVESVVIAIAKPDADEAAWAAQTREWLARVQAEKRKAAWDALPKGAAELPDGWQEVGPVPFVRSTSHLLTPEAVPQKAEVGAALKVRMARNEIEPAQFGVYAQGADLKNVRVSVGELKNEQGEALAASVELYAADYAVNTEGKLFPQTFWPVYALDISQGRAQLYWLNVTTAADKSKPGKYKGALKIEADGAKEKTLDLEVEVLPITLLTMKEAQLHMGSCVTGLLPAHEYEFLVKQNQNSINLWASGVAPEIKKKGKGEFDLDFTQLDDTMQALKDAGVENFVYFLGGDPYGVPDTWNLERELYRRVVSDNPDMMAGRKEFLKKVCENPDKLLPELRPLYVSWARQFITHAKDKGWPEPILTPFDEPAKWSQKDNWANIYSYIDKKSGNEIIGRVVNRDLAKFLEDRKAAGEELTLIGKGGAGAHIKPHFKDACAAIHEAVPGARIYGSIHHAETGLPFLDDIDVFCTNAIHEDPKLGDKVRAAPNKTFWQYSGAGYNSDLAGPRYAFGFFFGAFNSRGSLLWAYNWGSRFDCTSGNQWVYAWTSPYSVIRGPGFEGVREAWDDRRYIETLKVAAKKAGKEAEANTLLEEIFNSAVQSRTAGGRDTVNDFWARSKDPEVLDNMRAKIADLIVKIGQ